MQSMYKHKVCMTHIQRRNKISQITLRVSRYRIAFHVNKTSVASNSRYDIHFTSYFPTYL